MTLRLRRILYTTFIIIFFLAAPPLVLYTSGYRYDFRFNRVVETGSLVIRSSPEKAQIYLDEKLYHQTTPTIVNNILPGKMVLRVAKEGYHDWQETLIIATRVTAFQENIKLYPKRNPEIALAKKIKNYWWNNKGDKLIYWQENGELRFVNFLNKSDNLILNLKNNEIIDLAWSENADKFYLTFKESGRINNLVIDPLQGELNLNLLFGSRFDKLQWDFNSGDGLYATSRQSLYRLNLPLKQARLLESGPISQFLAEKERILLLENGGRPEITYVSIRGLAENDVATRISTRLGAAAAEFIKTNSDLIAIYDPAAERLELIDSEVKTDLLYEPLSVRQNIANIIFSFDGRTMVYSDGFAIYQESAKKENKSERILIIRYSKPLSQLAWADDQAHLFYLLGDSLRVAEVKSAIEPRVLRLIENAGNLKKINYLAPLEVLTYLEDGYLKYLPLTLPNPGALLFSD